MPTHPALLRLAGCIARALDAAPQAGHMGARRLAPSCAPHILLLLGEAAPAFGNQPVSLGALILPILP
eukprot:4906001-Pyramimonas_sp.AAC.1